MTVKKSSNKAKPAPKKATSQEVIDENGKRSVKVIVKHG